MKTTPQTGALFHEKSHTMPSCGRALPNNQRVHGHGDAIGIDMRQLPLYGVGAPQAAFV